MVVGVGPVQGRGREHGARVDVRQPQRRRLLRLPEVPPGCGPARRRARPSRLPRQAARHAAGAVGASATSGSSSVPGPRLERARVRVGVGEQEEVGVDLAAVAERVDREVAQSFGRRSGRERGEPVRIASTASAPAGAALLTLNGRQDEHEPQQLSSSDAAAPAAAARDRAGSCPEARVKPGNGFAASEPKA